MLNSENYKKCAKKCFHKQGQFQGLLNWIFCTILTDVGQKKKHVVSLDFFKLEKTDSILAVKLANKIEIKKNLNYVITA